MPSSTRAAVLDEDGMVVNVVELGRESDWRPGPGLTLQRLDEGSPVSPGQVWDGEGWASAPEPEPAHPAAPVVDPDLITAWQDATTNAQLRAAGLAIFVAAGLVPAPDA